MPHGISLILAASEIKKHTKVTLKNTSN